MRRRLLFLAALAAPAAFAPSVEAEIVRFTFTGTITAISGQGTPPPEIELGAPFTVSFVFDTLDPDVDPAPNFGAYETAVRTASADINTLLVNATGGYITVLNNGFVGDTVFYESVTPEYRLQVSLTDNQRTALDNDALPADLDFPLWDMKNMYLGDLTAKDSWTAIGTIATFEREVVVCPADWDSNGQVNSADISAFLTAWLDSVQNGNLNADFNGDLQVNSSDISAFLTGWLNGVETGC